MFTRCFLSHFLIFFACFAQVFRDAHQQSCICRCNRCLCMPVGAAYRYACTPFLCCFADTHRASCAPLMVDIPPCHNPDIVIQIKIYSIYYHQKGHKKDTKRILMIHFLKIFRAKYCIYFSTIQSCFSSHQSALFGPFFIALQARSSMLYITFSEELHAVLGIAFFLMIMLGCCPSQPGFLF